MNIGITYNLIGFAEKNAKGIPTTSYLKKLYRPTQN